MGATVGKCTALAIVTAILVGVVMLRSSGQKPVEIVGQSHESSTLATEAPSRGEPDLAAITEAELKKIQRMIGASDVEGLRMMLSEGQPRSKIAAASFLATTGDAHLIGELAQLAACFAIGATVLDDFWNLHQSGLMGLQMRLKKQMQIGLFYIQINCR